MNRASRLFAILASLVGATPAMAQSQISKIIVPFAPGGSQDVLARILAPELQRELGDTFIVESRAGAGGAIGAQAVARSKPDGTTLLMAASSHTISAALDPKIPYDPVKDFTAVAHVGNGAYVVVVSAKLPVKSVAELIAHAKANPGKLNYSTAGVGSATHLVSAAFAHRAGIDMVHVPYKGTAEAFASVMANDTQMHITPLIGSQGFLENKDLRALAVVSKARVRLYPDLPTVSENGLPGFEFTSWFGLLGPANIPVETAGKINAAMGRMLATPRFAETIEKQGLEPKALSVAEFTGYLDEHFVLMKQIIKDAKIAAN